MKQWIGAQLGRGLDGLSGTIVVLDPDGVMTEVDIDELADECELFRVDDWVGLRCVWDLDIRKRDRVQRVGVLVGNHEFQSAIDLPWDIEHEAATTVRVRWPVPSELRPLFRAAGDHADALARASLDHSSSKAIVAAAFKVRPGSVADELDAIARLRLDPATPRELWDALGGIFVTPLAQEVALREGGLDDLQNAWNDWLRFGDSSPFAGALSQAPGALIAMLGSGLLTLAAALGANLPKWTSVGAAEPDPDALIGELLAVEPAVPTTISEWIEAASWWGQVRSAIASQPSPPVSAGLAWEAWQRLDDAFADWLRRSYGGTLLSASATPRAVHQIAPYLARRIDDGVKIVLVVIDGLGFAQWHQLRSTTGIRVVQTTGCLAMIPTLTTNSRQAILSGLLPIDFVDTIDRTSAEPRRWQEFWSEHGLAEREVSYTRTLGVDRADVPDLNGRAVAVVVNAVDEMLHGAEVLGDRQVAAGVDLWARAGFLSSLVGKAIGSGYEVWITSDHGNLPTIPGHVLREGQTVYDAAGTRVRLYPNEILRARSADFGIIWDPPGYPRGTRCPLFAAGRSGFHGSGSRVSHGGLSIDEVIVPFVQVAP